MSEIAVARFADRIRALPRDMTLFLWASILSGFAGNLFDSVFNNYLSDSYKLSNFSRTFLELPRELPGLLIVFVSALLFFMCSRRLGAVAMLLMTAGLACITLFSINYHWMLAWLFLYSIGQHLFLPINSTIGMELAREGSEGRRLGQLSSARTAAAICGSFCVFLGFKFLHFTYATAFAIGTICFAAAAIMLLRMTAGKPPSPGLHLKLHREYSLYYALVVLFGMRKQIFLTFAPWVLVTVYKQPASVIATLLTIGGVLGIVTQPLIGRGVDRLGERFVLAAEAAILVVICLGYGFSHAIFPEHIALYVTAGCYVVDQLLMGVGMARATYLKKISLRPDHVAPTLTMGTSIDHIFSISTALLCGMIWSKWGFGWVFLCAAGIAGVNFFTALRIRIGGR